MSTPKPKKITGWHFAASTLRDGSPIPAKGTTLTHSGRVILGNSGYHASERLIDALFYAHGPFVARVELSGTIVPHGGPTDKYAASERTNTTAYVNVSRELHLFACDEAERALNTLPASGVDPRSREAIRVKRLWIDDKVTDEELAAAWDAAWAAAWAAASAAAWHAAWAAASAAASAAAWDAANAAAWDAERAAANERLTAVIVKALEDRE